MTIDWDHWRGEHARMTFADQQAFYRRVAEEHPCQQSFDVPHAQGTFDRIGGSALEVLELGGWDGALAQALLSTRTDIASWTNYDIVAVSQVCRHPRYRLELLGDYLWNQDEVRGDVFLACHTVEHLTAAELARLFDVLRVEFIYLQAPIEVSGRSNWDGYNGSHILEIGWDEIDALLLERGYAVRGQNLWGRA